MATKKTAKKSKKDILKSVEKLNRAKLSSKPKEKKTTDDRTWLEKYTDGAESSTSSAKRVTRLLLKFASVEECSQLALKISKGKGTSWGTTSHIKSHLRYLGSKGCKVIEKDGKYTVS